MMSRVASRIPRTIAKTIKYLHVIFFSSVPPRREAVEGGGGGRENATTQVGLDGPTTAQKRKPSAATTKRSRNVFLPYPQQVYNWSRQGTYWLQGGSATKHANRGCEKTGRTSQRVLQIQQNLKMGNSNQWASPNGLCQFSTPCDGFCDDFQAWTHCHLLRRQSPRYLNAVNSLFLRLLAPPPRCRYVRPISTKSTPN